METISAPHPEWLEIQHAGPSSMAYTAGSPIIRATIHGQRGCLLSLIPRFYPDEGRRRKSSRIGHDGIVLWNYDPTGTPVGSGRGGTVPAFENQNARLDEGGYIRFARPTWTVFTIYPDTQRVGTPRREGSRMLHRAPLTAYHEGRFI
jgi:hypothetical protein